MSHVTVAEKVVVADEQGEKLVTLIAVERYPEEKLFSVSLIGKTAGRRFTTYDHQLAEDDERTRNGYRRFTVKNLAGGHPLDLDGNPAKRKGNRARKGNAPKLPSNPKAFLKLLVSEDLPRDAGAPPDGKAINFAN